MDALYTFAVGFTSVRPIVPEQHTSYVTLLGDDSVRGRLAAERTAIAMVLGCNLSEMATSSTLIDVEL